MSDTARKGRGLVISGVLLIALTLIVTFVVAAYILFFDSLVAMGVATGLASVMVPIGLAIVTPSWFVGVPLLAIGRSRQRGPVKGAVLAWIVALAAVPVALVLLLIVLDASVTAFYAGTAEPVPMWVTYAIIALVPLAIVSAFAAVAWLASGKPARDPATQGGI